MRALRYKRTHTALTGGNDKKQETTKDQCFEVSLETTKKSKVHLLRHTKETVNAQRKHKYIFCFILIEQKDYEQMYKKIVELWEKDKEQYDELTLLLKETFENRREEIGKMTSRTMMKTTQRYPCFEKPTYVRIIEHGNSYICVNKRQAMSVII